MRLFVGLSAPPEVRAPILAVIDQLRPFVKLAWTPEAKLHVTTKFIGDWPEARLAELQQALSMVAVATPVDVHIQGLLWMSSALCAGVQMTGDLHAATESALERIGIAKERRAYCPHVTLGRARRRESFGEMRAALDIAPFRATSFHLYLSGNGTYTKLSDYQLPS
jgi:2'-5' RNA ligase